MTKIDGWIDGWIGTMTISLWLDYLLHTDQSQIAVRKDECSTVVDEKLVCLVGNIT